MSQDLWLVVQPDEGQTRDVAVRAPAESSISDLAASLAGMVQPAVSSGAGWQLYCHRRQRWLRADDLVTSAGIQHGDIVAITPAGTGSGGDLSAASAATAAVTIRFTAGPRVGSEMSLAAGEYTIGRSEESTVRLDDPFVAPEQARLEVSVDRLVVTNLASNSGTIVEGDVLTGSRGLKARQTITIGSSTLEVTHQVGAPDAGRAPSASGSEGAEVRFNRPPRVIIPATHAVHRLGAPPSEPSPARLPIAASLLPLVLGGVMLVFYRNAITLVFIALSPLMAIGSYLEGRLGGRGEHRKAVDAFRMQLETLRQELAAAREAEFKQRREEGPDLRRLALAAHRREAWVWERRPQDDDFLALRVALTAVPSRQRVEVEPGGAIGLRQEAEAALQPLTSVQDVPMILSLAERGTVALAGPRRAVLDAARWMLTEAAVLHSPRNLSICAALPREEADEWDWLKWLPHTRELARQVDGAGLCADNASSRDLVEKLADLLDARLAEIGPFRGTGTRAPFSYVLVLLHEDVPLARRTVTRLLAEGPRVGIVTVWLGSAVRDLPNECQAVVEVDGAGNVTLTLPAEGEVRRGTGIEDQATGAEARQVALELAPLRDIAAGDARGELPRQVGLLDLLGLSGQPSARDVAARWSHSGGGLAAPVGVSAAGPFLVDLRADGPHGLVGGTTGSGKSELLQGLVAALAATHPPSRLNFLLVDYKGGSAFKDAARLPHTVGLVTDLDGHLANRVLVSLRAELHRREKILLESSARDLVELERRGTADCPPSLVIVVDEFATLAKEVPEFVEGVVDLAQRGRSLGLHVLLATQRPAGVINDNIRANTNLRVALRVSGEAESTDVIGVPDAARILRTLPGRAIARTGHQELTEFQSAFAGAVRHRGRDAASVEVVTLPLSGPAFSVAAIRAASGSEDTDLQRIVAAVAAAHLDAGGAEVKKPWLPELALILPVQSLTPRPGGGEGGVALGQVDVPAEQRQEAWTWDLHEDGNLLVLGTSGSGKTSLLRATAHALAVKYPPTELHMYAIDCAGGGLAAVSELPHCGGLFFADDTERIARLVQYLRALVDRRRASVGASSARQGGGGEPLVVVLLDSYSGFMSSMEKVDLGEHVDALPRLVADGPAVGVHFVLSADRRAAVPSAVSSLVGLRLVLRMADEDEYRNAGLAADAFKGADLPPGRGFLGKGLEVQCVVLGASGEPGEQAQVLAATGAAIRERFGDVAVPAVRLLPSHVSVATLSAPTAELRAVIGLLDVDARSAEMDLADDGQLVAGPPHSGRSNTLLVAVRSLRASTPGARLFLLAPRRSPLLALDLFDEVARGADGCEKLAAMLEEMLSGAGLSTDRGPTIVVVDDGDELAEGQTSMRLEAIVRRGRDQSVRLIGAVETRAAHRAYGGWISELRKTRQGLLLQPDLDIDGDLLGVRLPRRGSRVYPPGRGFLVYRGAIELVQVAVPTTT